MAGNANSGKRAATQFYDALNVALKDDKAGPNVRLRKVADKLVKEAEKGEAWAIKEVADRLDGKPAQTVRGDEDQPFIARILVTGVPRPQDYIEDNSE